MPQAQKEIHALTSMMKGPMFLASTKGIVFV
jgi:hypothetical protein